MTRYRVTCNWCSIPLEGRGGRKSVASAPLARLHPAPPKHKALNPPQSGLQGFSVMSAVSATRWHAGRLASSHHAEPAGTLATLGTSLRPAAFLLTRCPSSRMPSAGDPASCAPIATPHHLTLWAGLAARDGHRPPLQSAGHSTAPASWPRVALW